MENFVYFNSNGLRLYGILHVPENNVFIKKTWINILNPGVKNRVAPNRLNIKIARMLCEKGFYVFRFDPKGIGDSEGDISNNNNIRIDLWGDIQKGLFVDDTLESITFITNTIMIEKVVIIGACGGAITAILSAYRNKNITGIIMIDTPVRIATSDISITDTIIDKRIEYLQYNEIYKKIFKKDSWNKLYKLHGSENIYSFIKYISKNMFNKLMNLFKYINKAPHFSKRFNYEFFHAFNKLVNRIDILFIFSEKDVNLMEFKEDIGQYVNKFKNNRYFQIRIIKNANHIFTEEESQSELFKNIDNWIEKYSNDGIIL